jgi:hypothetical protein
MSTTETLSSTGHLATSLGVSVAKLLAAAEQVGVKPALFINSIAHYDERGEAAIRRHLARGKQEVNYAARVDLQNV